jgi:arylsulfatase A-like enzyme
VLTADHGEEGEIYVSHGYGTTLELAYVSFILRAPGWPPGRRSEPVHPVDFIPTLLELAGLLIPEEARGVALGQVVRAESTLPPRLLFVNVGLEVSAYQDDRLLRTHLREKTGNVARGTGFAG